MRVPRELTPEGRYLIDHHNPLSGFRRALHVAYPSVVDVARARAGNYDPGGEIMVHGLMNGLGWVGRAHRFLDWTVGCIAVRIIADANAVQPNAGLSRGGADDADLPYDVSV